MAPVQDGTVRMAWIACYASYSINGVAALHTEIIKRETLGDWHGIWPERFNNKTNGVTPRRWLRMCNPPAFRPAHREAWLGRLGDRLEPAYRAVLLRRGP